MNAPLVYRRSDSPIPYAVLRRMNEFGFEEVDILRPSIRFWSDEEPTPATIEFGQDVRRLTPIVSPAALLASVPPDSWMTMTRRSLARVFAWFLIAEDPQRRLSAKSIVTLAHQASVVQHIKEQSSLKRVLLADEVGLGKTVEAGLLISRVLEDNAGARVLYLAPARLVRNVRRELNRLGLQFRAWTASDDSNATLSDPLVVASIHRAAHENRIKEVLAAPAWDVIVVDECHHLSDWQPGGGKPVAQYRLVEKLAARLGDEGRLLLMSGTPHQGHEARFENILRLLQRSGEREDALAGRVIYRTKDDVFDWDSKPLFPRRQVNTPCVVDLGEKYQAWLTRILAFFEPHREQEASSSDAKRRAAGWRAGQALQWATSSVQAGLGYLIRQAIRTGESPDSLPALTPALRAIRPYRMGAADESVAALWRRLSGEVARQAADDNEEDDLDDIEEADDRQGWRPNPKVLAELLDAGVELLRTMGDQKWEAVWRNMLEPAGTDKVVLFAQPIETVTAVAAFLERKTGKRPALIIGNQSETQRQAEVESFWDANGPQFLVSSRAGGEGINLQIAHRLVHLDVPWNPMDLEQRVGRVHRFMSRRTIVVDTIVAKDSREVATYDFARQKLHAIANALVPEKSFESLFERVMALVPPEELQKVLKSSSVGPLPPEERSRLTELVTRGFDQWRSFHDTYSVKHKEIAALNPGAATWQDLSQFAREYLNATPANGYSVLKFILEESEVRESSQVAEVLSLSGVDYVCADYGGMPVTRDDGLRAERLGTNLGVVARAIRSLAYPELATGAAHIRWPEKGTARPMSGVFGVIVVARHTVRTEGGHHVEQGLSLHVSLVGADLVALRVEPGGCGDIVRGLVNGTVRRDPESDPALLKALVEEESSLCRALRIPTPDERADGILHAVTPLLAAFVA